MEDKSTKLFLKSLIGEVYKILPMKESNDEGLSYYLDSLCIQLLGGLESFSELKRCNKYISILNVIQFFRINEYDTRTCKREVLKCTNLLEKLSKS